jgi:tRNA threonylcarbamoyladenosine biosynthesis protein TsaE
VYEIYPKHLPDEFRGRPTGYSLEAKEEVYHFDCYRIKDLREAMDMGTEEYLYSGNYCFIEWAEMIEPLLPEDTVNVQITVEENGDRTLIVNN